MVLYDLYKNRGRKMKQLIKKIVNSMGYSLMSNSYQMELIGSKEQQILDLSAKFIQLQREHRKLENAYVEAKERIDGNEHLNEYGRTSFSLDGEDVVSRKFFDWRGVNSGFYVDLGANHPWRTSNTAYFHLRGWTGINVEPNPDLFKLFCEHRPNDINLNVGVASQDGHLDYYMFDLDICNTFSKEAMEKECLKPEMGKPRIKSIPVMHINDILKKSNGRNIDFMSIDIEGFELDVLSAMDFALYKPTMIWVELHGVVTVEDLLNHAVYRLLGQRGYQLYSHTQYTYCFVLS
jgi:FkbM family methyltransferase